MKRIIGSLFVVTTLSLTVAGCGDWWKDDRGKGDAPVNQLEDKEVTVYPNGDGYPNISFFCAGENGVYSTTREAPPVVVASDPNCTE